MFSNLHIKAKIRASAVVYVHFIYIKIHTFLKDGVKASEKITALLRLQQLPHIPEGLKNCVLQKVKVVKKKRKTSQLQKNKTNKNNKTKNSFGVVADKFEGSAWTVLLNSSWDLCVQSDSPLHTVALCPLITLVDGDVMLCPAPCAAPRGSAVSGTKGRLCRVHTGIRDELAKKPPKKQGDFFFFSFRVSHFALTARQTWTLGVNNSLTEQSHINSFSVKVVG